MKFFVCLLDLEEHRVSTTMRRLYESLPRARGFHFQWQPIGRSAVLTGGDEPACEPVVASTGDWAAAGTVRLDNRPAMEQWLGYPCQGLRDLDLLLHVIARDGAVRISQMLGDFAFVAWNEATHTSLAACDALGVRKLYYARRNGVFAFASRAEALAVTDAYDTRYLAELIAGCDPSPGATPYVEVSALPAATVASIAGSQMTMHRYWSAHEFAPVSRTAHMERELAEECRHLLATSVQLRLTGRDDTWAQLSGGMDSSSIVSTAQWLLERGELSNALAGTVTYVDHHGTGADETMYSNAVVERFGLRNERVVDHGMWQEDAHGAPYTDAPSPVYPLYARERKLCMAVRANGGRVLLTGNGGDQLFAGNMFFFADWAVTGRCRAAIREMAHRAAIGRVSFWSLAYRNALLPLLPAAIQRRLLNSGDRVPAWITREADRRYQLRAHAFTPTIYAGRLGSKYGDAVAASVAATPGTLDLGILTDALDVRHPFLYRPLVEFALRLPPELCVQPYARKWLLREAMRDILPDVVRRRIGKGTLAGPSAWALAHQSATLEALLQDPILAQLGIIEPAQFRAAFTAAQSAPGRREKLYATVHSTLGVEAWLRVRSGRWPHGASSALQSTSSQPALT